MILSYLYFPCCRRYEELESRYFSIDHALYYKYDIMFTNIVATGQYDWAPSHGLNSDNDGVGEMKKNDTNEVNYDV